MKHMIYGLTPFNVPREVDGGYLTPSSVKFAPGPIPVCWKHWREDDFIFSKPAGYLLDGGGILFTHLLDESIPRELEVLKMVRAGLLFWSYGLTSSPLVTRGRVFHYETRVRPNVEYRERPLTGETIAHLSYVLESAFKSEPLRAI